jgi:4-hydroxybenzoate polyprenyltransferase
LAGQNDEILAVDLDGTFLRTDLLQEAILILVRTNPGGLARATLLALKGGHFRLTLKQKLAELVAFENLKPVVNQELFERLESKRRNGTKLVLATASPEKWALEVQSQFKIFDSFLTTSSENGNLKGRAKRDLLVARFGEQGFDYIGDSSADEIVGASARNFERIMPLRPRAKSLIRQLRPHQWSKNLLIALPLLAAHGVTTLSTGLVIAALVAFSLLASSLYIVNDLLDLQTDRAHPTKSKRPVAGGEISIGLALLIAVVLIISSVAISVFLLPPSFLLVLLGYAAGSVAYSLKLKTVPLLDIFVLAALYWTRILAGAIAASVFLSPWFQLFIGFLFFGLAAMKRYGEGHLVSENGASKDLEGRGYTNADFPFIISAGMAASTLSVLVLGTYSATDEIVALYSRPEILLVGCVFLWLWVMRLWFLAQRGQITSDPVLFALRDRTSLAIALLTAGAVLIAI